MYRNKGINRNLTTFVLYKQREGINQNFNTLPRLRKKILSSGSPLSHSTYAHTRTHLQLTPHTYATAPLTQVGQRNKA